MQRRRSPCSPPTCSIQRAQPGLRLPLHPTASRPVRSRGAGGAARGGGEVPQAVLQPLQRGALGAGACGGRRGDHVPRDTATGVKGWQETAAPPWLWLTVVAPTPHADPGAPWVGLRLGAAGGGGAGGAGSADRHLRPAAYQAAEQGTLIPCCWGSKARAPSVRAKPVHLQGTGRSPGDGRGRLGWGSCIIK